MRVEVQLFATLARFLPPGSREGAAMLDLADGSTARDLITGLGIPPGLDQVLLVNGREADPDQRLAPGDVVTIFPPLAGGRRCPVAVGAG